MTGSDAGLDAAGRRRLAAIRAAESLAALASVVDAADEHEAYFTAKREWRDLRGRELAVLPRRPGLPGSCVVVDGHTFCAHGVTHAATDAERTFLREHVTRAVDAGATVYCEQGIRRMYFDDLPAVCEMDDYRWAMQRCAELDVDSHVGDLLDGFDGLADQVDSLAARFQTAVFSLVDSGREVYGEEFARALGDVASSFLTSHAGLAVGDEFASFRLSRAAAEDPARLRDLQHYYERAFLPQPLEREWLRRHDPELELVTHARNERMADYAVYHNDDAERVHLVVGAAHQPGVRYYLERFRDGDRELSGFEPV
ncbi:hypothetical protein [Halorarius litoreus]|uniref:hypothetical protein n=1 Tax=Halorarius litoreus TaxID=2962676 RepID=UPI0020CBB5CF|nr:hypothetical protein [Halorarius litoreus]